VLLVVPFSLGILLGKGRTPDEGLPGRFEAEGPASAEPASTEGEAPDLARFLAAFEGTSGVSVTRAGERIRVVFLEGIFPLGSVAPESDGRAALASVVPALRRIAQDAEDGVAVEVAGYCDNTPTLPGGSWPDNWCLSFDRAHAAVEFLRGQTQDDPIVWLASARGERDPPFSNETDEDRSRNRTVVLYLSPAWGEG
jgi:flagellar motor protein MotB